MTELVTVTEKFPHAAIEPKRKYCDALERGNILFFPQCPFEFVQEDRAFLLAQKQTNASYRKNIAYKPQLDKISNFIQASPEQSSRLLQIMRHFSHSASTMLAELLAPYAAHWQLDYASFRPFQEKGRALRTRARNDLLHTDAFPTRPMHGARILRFFININPSESRHWLTTDSFEVLAKQFGGEGGVPFPSETPFYTLVNGVKKCARKLGFPVIVRSPYDIFMLNLHNFLKENETFQKNCPKKNWEFPPNCCWIVYTDQVSHAATSGQYALEQTFIVPPHALLNPELSPVNVLEQLSGKKMISRL